MASGAAAGGPSSELYSYQRTVVDWLKHNPTKSLLLAHGMGTGKTRTAVVSMKESKQRFVLIAPLAVHGQWTREIEKQGCEDLAYPKILNPGGLPALLKKKREVQELYDFLRQGAALIIDEAHKFKTMDFDAPKSIAEYDEWIDKKLLDFVVPPKRDQLWRFSKITIQAVLELADRACRVLALTGTPMLNAPSDFAIYFRMCLNRPLTKQLFYFTPSQFRLLFVGPMGPTPRFGELACGMVSVVEIEDREKRARYEWPYQFDDRVERIAVSPEEVRAIQATPRGMYLSLLRASTVGQKIQSPEFLVAVEHIVSEIRNARNTKFAIYSNFIEKGLNVIQQMLTKENIAYSTITGDTKDTEREQENYNAGLTNVILLSPAAQEGVDLKNTNVMFIMDLNWNQSQQDQIRARVFRLGSHVSKTYDFDRDVLKKCSGWVLLTYFDPFTDTFRRERYRAEAIPEDRDFRKMQFVRDQTVIVKTMLLMTEEKVYGSDVAMLQAQATKNASIEPFMKVLKTVSIEERAECAPVTNVDQLTASASKHIYSDQYPSGQDPTSPCFQYECRITPTLAQGDCFFDATRIALTAAGQVVTVRQLRGVLADAITDATLIEFKRNADAAPAAGQQGVAADYRAFKNVQTLAEAKALVTQTSWWAEDISIIIIARQFRIMFLIFRPDASDVQYLPEYNYDDYEWIVPLWHTGNHYENISCNGSMIYARGDPLPPTLMQALMFKPNSIHSFKNREYRVTRRMWTQATRANPLPQLRQVGLQNERGSPLLISPNKLML